MASIWIDALEFANKGGWSVETQFAHEMGQGYLFAIGLPGEPVADASTGFTSPEAGCYRVWVRTKNWLVGDAPGRFRVLVDGDYMPTELGAIPCHGWYWEIAGDIELDSGSHTITVKDTTGWFGRFASIIITDNMDYTPSPEKERVWRERARMRGESERPVDAGHFDVIVAGAGPAGIPAALSAARKGLKVALINARPAVGGNSSDEGTIGFDGAASNHSGWRETGIADEIRRTRDTLGLTWQGAQEKLLSEEKNITVFSNQFVIDTDTENDVIRSVTTLDCINCVRYVYHGEYFIDCTGDGWLGYYAGALYRLGREPKRMYNESFAPDNADSYTMSGCLVGSVKGNQAICYYAEDVGHYVPFTAPDWAVKLPQGDLLFRTPERLTSGEWWVENPTDMDDLWEQEYIRDELMRLSLGYFHWIKNSYSRRDMTANLKLTGFPRYNGKRETRRLIGDYVLTQNDVTKVTVFDDAISYCGWTLDVHHPRGLYSGIEGPYYSDAAVPITSIPYRCIYSKNIRNLFMAGRCVSVSHLALGTVRVESTLATLGQAAGTAAALCLKNGYSPRELGNEHIPLLQQTLLRDDQSIPWVTNTDEADLARTAQVSASSVSRTERFVTEMGIEEGWDELDVNRATCVTKRQRTFGVSFQPDFYRVQLKNGTDTPVTVHASLAVGSPEVPDVKQTVDVTIPAGFCGMIDLPFEPMSFKDSWMIMLDRAPGVFWRQVNLTASCRKRAKQLNRYRWEIDKNNAYRLDYSKELPPPANCAPENVINGINRAVSAEKYAWVSDPAYPMPQYLTFTLKEKSIVSQAAVTLDTDSKHPSYSYMTLPVTRQTVKAFDVQAQIGGDWKTVASVRDNFLRHVVVDFESVETDQMRIVVLETNGDPSARIFEVRLY